MKILQIVAITSTLLSSAASAYPIDPVEDKETWWNPEKIVYPQPNQAVHKTYRYVAALSLGPGWGYVTGNNQTFSLQQDLVKSYVTSPNSSALGYGELFAGLQTVISDTIALQFGLGLGGGTDTALQGDIWEDADPDFNNYYYEL